MLNTSLKIAGLAFALAAASSPAMGQMRFGVAGGASVPTGDLGEFQSTGYTGALSVGFRPMFSPVGLRVEGMWHQLQGKTASSDIGSITMPDLRVAGLTANLVMEVPGIFVRPYIIGGAGVYNNKSQGSESSNEFGVNAGLGLNFRLAGFETYAEARFHNQFLGDNGLGENQSAQFVPITFGIAF